MKQLDLAMKSLLLVPFLLVGAASAQEPFVPDAAPHYHASPSLFGVMIEPAFEDYAFMLFDICDALEISSEDCMIYPMMGPIENAVATILDGNRVIIYDRRLSEILGYDGAKAVIAHELGHHLCGHIGDMSVPLHDSELQADRFAGAAMRKMNFERGSLDAIVEIFSDRPSRSHPPKAQRIAAINAGWDDPSSALDC